MIFYFSGTGNSLWVAKELSKVFDEKLISVADELKSNQNLTYQLDNNEKIFFVFPVHSWGPPILINEFIKKFTLENYKNQPVYVVFTFAGICGYADRIFRKTLRKKNITLTNVFSILMPRTYILMKDFKTDPKELEQEKLQNAPLRLNKIVENIKSNSSQELYSCGTSPFFRSRILHPLFKTVVAGKNSFYVTDNCTSCGLCEKICPIDTIYMENGKPKWRKNCVQCTACIHRCPSRAIEFGNITQNTGRYHHPDV